MRVALLPLVLLVSLGLSHCDQHTPLPAITADTLRQLSLEGEKLVNEEVGKALYGVKQMKEVMAWNEEKHEHLMRSLRHTDEKKKGAAEIAQEVEQKLDQAQQQCEESLRSSWEECRPCLEDACKSFYTSTCRRGFSTFSSKMESFFRRVSARLGSRSVTEELALNQSTESPSPDVARIEDSFNTLMTKVGQLVNRSVVLVSSFNRQLDQNLNQAFSPESQSEDKEEALQKASESLDSAFLQGVGLEEVLDSLFEFGRNVVEEFGAVITQVFKDLNHAAGAERRREGELLPQFLQDRRLCRDLRRQSSECWQLQSKCAACQGTMLAECPSVRELHVELDEVSQLLEVSKQQYEEVLAIVQRHTDDTVSWVNNMATDFGWVAGLADNTTAPESVFSIVKVLAQSEEEDSSPVVETKVEVNILNSPALTLSVPTELELQDPAFIQYVANQALGRYKQMVSHEDA